MFRFYDGLKQYSASGFNDIGCDHYKNKTFVSVDATLCMNLSKNMLTNFIQEHAIDMCWGYVVGNVIFVFDLSNSYSEIKWKKLAQHVLVQGGCFVEWQHELGTNDIRRLW